MDGGDARPLVLVCGVAGSGKTTAGRRVADRLGVPFADADEFHSPAAVAAMAAGVPLTDADRAPWIARLARLLAAWHDARCGGVLACSALRPAHRRALAGAAPGLTAVLLTAPEPILRARLAARRADPSGHTGHFFPPGLLASQLAALDVPPGDALPRIDTGALGIDEAAAAVVALVWLGAVRSGGRGGAVL